MLHGIHNIVRHSLTRMDDSSVNHKTTGDDHPFTMEWFNSYLGTLQNTSRRGNDWRVNNHVHDIPKNIDQHRQVIMM